MTSEYVLEMKNISKEYSNNVVLQNVNLSIKAGEVIALVGENGAGKSTLMNILFGMPVIHSTGGFDGEIFIDGDLVDISNPRSAMNYGIGMVHQEFMLINGYEINENVKLNRENLKPGVLKKILGDKVGLLDRKAMRQETASTLEELGLNLSATEITGNLPVGLKQFIEISRELDKKNIRLIVLDEPTAVLTENEAEKFLECVKAVSQKGISFIFISHRLKEVKQFTDKTVILRDGRLVGEYATEEVSVENISELMIGHSISFNEKDKSENTSFKEIKLELNNFAVHMPGEMLKKASMKVFKGEIFGLAGLAGHGKAAIANGLMGLFPTTGEVYLGEDRLDVTDTLETLEKGVAFVSEDRRGVGLLLNESIEVNIIISALRVRNQYLKKIAGMQFYNKKAAKGFVEEMIDFFDIRCTTSGQLVRLLSGGNQQKVCMARAFASEPDLLLISEPTRGIDVGAKKRILDALVEKNAKEGTTIIVTSSELAELRSICNRIAIVTDGEIIGILDSDAESYRYGMLMSGISEM
jgi:simple sugar transport system ATP-binding protein